LKWLKAFSIPVLSFGLVYSAIGPAVAGQASVTAPVQKTKQGAPVDLAIANDQRLIEMLKKKGTIATDASPEDAEKALQQYLQKLAAAAPPEKANDSFSKNRTALTEQIKTKMDSSGIYNGKGNKTGLAKQNTVSPVKSENWDGQQRKDEVLVLLIDFKDLPHGQLTKDETDMYYSGPDAYSHQHYQDMIFGTNGYMGPDGKRRISMKQFYEQQSGGSYTVDGEVAGWYTASKPAADYGKHDANGNNDADPRALIKEALNDAAKDPNVDLNKYDQEDPYDIDGDGNTREPDGIIDHLMVIHSGVGEEAGGGKIGEDAIWSHSWDLGYPYNIPDTTAKVGYWGGQLTGFGYTIEPEDGAAGVFAHEFGHNLGLPDEYDTLYSGSGEPVSYWSIMSAGSWSGAIPGTEPSGFSPYDKEFLQQSMTTADFIPNWQSGTEVNIADISSKGTQLLLDEASTKGTNNDVVRVDLPEKITQINTPASGTNEYYSGSANNLSTSMATTKKLDLTNAATAKLTFKTWYSIEQDFDYASVMVNGESIAGNITTDTNPNDANPGNGITGNSGGWVDASFDLSKFAGQQVTLSFNYKTDAGVSMPGFFADDINVTADGKQVLSDGAEGTPAFDLNGFSVSNGKKQTSQYYLLEWRTHNGSDSGLVNINRLGTMLSYDPGLIVWYVDNSYSDNWTGPDFHPGDGFLGVVDADQHNLVWHDKAGLACGDIKKCLGTNRYQMHDAAFSLTKGSDVTIGDKSDYLKDNFTQTNALFDDSHDYSNPQDPDLGRKVPNFGLKVRVVGQSSDGTVGKILLYK
jgi:immune inhibitor A